jgi:hypothetical protein
VAVVASRTEAELVLHRHRRHRVAGMLRSNDLRAAVSADDVGGQEPELQMQGVRILVAPSDEAPTRQSGNKTSSGKAGKGNPWLNGMLGEIAASAARTDTFLGERYRRLARRRGKRKALTAVARSILVIIFCLLSDRSARYHDLGPDFYDTQIHRDRKIRNHLRQLRALGVSTDDITTLLGKDPAAA